VKDSKARSRGWFTRAEGRGIRCGMDREGVAKWMDAYREAWISNDPGDIGALFTDDAVYAIDPFAPPWVGRDEIVRRWTAGISQDVEMTFEVVALEGDVAVVHWNVITQNMGDPVRVAYDGVVQLRFTRGGRCAEHREWFFRRELG
jgi:hypothetical protein